MFIPCKRIKMSTVNGERGSADVRFRDCGAQIDEKAVWGGRKSEYQQAGGLVMFTYSQRMEAVRLYRENGNSAAAVIRQLGYPKDRRTLAAWNREFEESNDLHQVSTRRAKYTAEQRHTAVEYWLNHGKCISETIRQLGYPSRPLLTDWIREDMPEEFEPRKMGDVIHLTEAEKAQAVGDMCGREGSVRAVAEKYGVSTCSLYKWKKQLQASGRVSDGRKDARAWRKSLDELQREVERLNREIEALSARHRELSGSFNVQTES